MDEVDGNVAEIALDLYVGSMYALKVSTFKILKRRFWKRKLSP